VNKKLTDFLDKYKISVLEDLKNAIICHGKNLPVEFVYEAAEYLNPNRESTAAYYTDRMICDYIFKQLPDFDDKDSLVVVEPSVGAGNFLPYVAEKYKSKKMLEINIIDIDDNELKIAELIFETYYREKYPNVAIRYWHDDYLLIDVSGRKFDLVIGNPPYSKIKDKALLAKYKKKSEIKKSSNLFALFLEKAMSDAICVSLIIPKSLLNAPEYEELRDIIKSKQIMSIIDFGENGFKGVKIETINIMVNTEARQSETYIESITLKKILIQEQAYITDSKYPSLLIYRNEDFDKFADSLQLGMFRAFRDRQIVSRMLIDKGKYRVLKSRNIGDRKITNIQGYDKYIDSADGLAVGKYLNAINIVLVPNLSYAPRACMLPRDTLADGSVALLENITSHEIKEADLAVFASEEFKQYYRVARNYGTRSLNIDNNSVHFFGVWRKN